VHVHGPYQRFANCNDQEEEDIPRFLCVPCGLTISVLPDHFLPYRPVAVSLVEEYFDAQANPGQAQEPPTTQMEKGCLKRAWNRFGQRMAALATVLCQMMKIRACAPKLFCSGLRRWGNLSVILLQFAQPFNTSLLHDYLCLRPWSRSTG
jgi:hypothetical protein